LGADGDREDHPAIASWKKAVMEQLLLKLADLGIVGIIAAVMAYDVFYLQKKLIQVVENNTKAMTDLKTFCAGRKAVKS
jgi:hypothetical protein